MEIWLDILPVVGTLLLDLIKEAMASQKGKEDT